MHSIARHPLRSWVRLCVFSLWLVLRCEQQGDDACDEEGRRHDDQECAHTDENQLLRRDAPLKKDRRRQPPTREELSGKLSQNGFGCACVYVCAYVDVYTCMRMCMCMFRRHFNSRPFLCARAFFEGRSASAQMAAAAAMPPLQSTMAGTRPTSGAHGRRKALNAMGARLRILERQVSRGSMDGQACYTSNSNIMAEVITEGAQPLERGVASLHDEDTFSGLGGVAHCPMRHCGSTLGEAACEVGAVG